MINPVDSVDAVELLQQDKRHHLHAMTNPVSLRETGPDMVMRAEGVYLYLSDGRRVMDVGSGLANVNIGYGNPRLCEAAYKTMRQLSFAHGFFGRSNPWAAALSAKLAELTPAQYDYFFFASTGSDAIESAVKMALRYWRLRDRPSKRAIISRRLSYHGNTLFAAGLTGIEAFHTQFGLPFGDMIHHAESTHWYLEGRGRSREEFCRDIVRALEQQILKIGPDNIAAFVGDPIQTGGGTIVPPAGYWPAVRRLCDQYDILLIADEIITGFGKTGRMFGFENFDFEPDLIVMAKGLSSGYFPISSVGVGAKVGEVIQSANELFAHAFTNCGHPVGAAVALESIAFIEEHGLVDRVRQETGPYFRKRLEELREFQCIGDIRSCGVLGGLDVDLSGGAHTSSKGDNDAFLDKVVQIAWRRGLAMRGIGLCLPMIITQEQIDEAVGILKGSIKEALQ